MIAASSRTFCTRSSGCRRRSFLVVRRTRSSCHAAPTLCSTHSVSQRQYRWQCLPIHSVGDKVSDNVSDSFGLFMASATKSATVSVQSICTHIYSQCRWHGQRRYRWQCRPIHGVSDKVSDSVGSVHLYTHTAPTLCSAHSVGHSVSDGIADSVDLFVASATKSATVSLTVLAQSRSADDVLTHSVHDDADSVQHCRLDHPVVQCRHYALLIVSVTMATVSYSLCQRQCRLDHTVVQCRCYGKKVVRGKRQLRSRFKRLAVMHCRHCTLLATVSATVSARSRVMLSALSWRQWCVCPPISSPNTSIPAWQHAWLRLFSTYICVVSTVISGSAWPRQYADC